MTRKQVTAFTGPDRNWPGQYVGFYSDSGATTPVTVFGDQIASGAPATLASGKTGASPVRRFRADREGLVPPAGVRLWVDSTVTTLYARPESATGVAVNSAAAVSCAVYGPDGPVAPTDPSSGTVTSVAGKTGAVTLVATDAGATPALAATAWTSGPLVFGVNTVDATAGNKTPALPTPTIVGQLLSVEKIDSSANTVTISGTIRGSASTLVLTSQYQDVVFVAESLTSWRPLADHRTAASLVLPGGLVVDAAAQYGVKGDGTTDNSTALAAAATAVNAAGGGVILLPAGTVLGANIPIKSRVHWQGRGRGVTVVKLPAASTGHVFKGDSFDTLTGGTTVGGPYQWGLRELTIDGNKANCPSGGRGVAVYGYEFRIRDVNIHRCKSDGLYLEYHGNDTYPDNQIDFEESWTSHVKVMDCDGHGVWANGNHDSAFLLINSARNGGGVAGRANFRLEGNGNHWIHCHGWGGNSDYAWDIRGHEILTACSAEGSAVAQFFVEFHDVHILGGEAYAPPNSTAKGVYFGTGTPPQRIIIDGLHLYQGAGASNVFAPAIDFSNLGVQALIRATIDQPSGTAYSGTVPTDARVDIQTGGGTATPNLTQMPGYVAAVTNPTVVNLPPALFDSFTGADASAPDATKWTKTTGSGSGTAVAMLSNAMKFTGGATGGYSVNDRVSLASAVSSALVDGELLFSYIVTQVTVESYFYAELRGSNAFLLGNTGYGVAFEQGTSGVLNTYVRKYVSGAATQLYSFGVQSPTVGTKKWVRFRVQGTAISFKYWTDGTAEPSAWTFAGTDSAVTAAGISGFSFTSGSAAASASASVGEAAIYAL